MVRPGDLVVVVEGDGAPGRAAGRDALGDRGHDRHLVAVTHPRGRLVRDAEALQGRAVLGVVALLVVVLPRLRVGVRHRGEEGEPVGDGADRQVVAAREGARAVGPATHVDGIRRAGAVERDGGGVDGDVVDPPAEARLLGRAGGVVVAEQDRVDRLAPGGGAEVDGDGVPLRRVEDLADALAVRGGGGVVGVGRAEAGEERAVGEAQVDRGVGRRVGQVAGDHVRGDLVAELRAVAHGDVDVEEAVPGEPAAGRGVLPAVAHRLDAGPADVRLEVEAGAGAGADGGDHRGDLRLGRGDLAEEAPVGELQQGGAVDRGDVSR